MNPHPEPDVHLSSQRLADLRDEAALLQRRLSELARLSLEGERAQPARRLRPPRAPFAEALWPAGEAGSGVTADFDVQDGLSAHFRPGHPAGSRRRDFPPAPDPLPATAVSGRPGLHHLDREAPGGAQRDPEPAPESLGPAPEYAEPEYAEPEYGEPEYGEPEYGEPEYGEPEYGEPEYGKPGYGEEGAAGLAGDLDTAERRTEVLVSRGRPSAYYRGLSRGRKLAIAAGAVTALIIVVVLLASGGSASWPPSVTVMQNEAARACQNPDVRSEPGQVNFACARSTRQILWVFALLTSGGNPRFTDPQTGRTGLEPITRAQGGAIAWSLNLHHPYNPANPIDSLQVAARAINNIVGGAAVTGPTGNPVVQPGLESSASNCLRYTGSASLITRSGFPDVCAQPLSGPAGQAALVADVYQRWMVDAPASAAEDAAVLFANAKNPGDPQVQTILRRLQLEHR